MALRPIIPEVPFEVPNAIRNLSPMDPTGSQALFNNVDPQGNPTAPITNKLVNFGWEYVLHCHILSHEEMDMMRPVAIALPPNAASGLSTSLVDVLDRRGRVIGQNVALTWADNSITETAFTIQRTTDGTTWTDVGASASPLDQDNTHGTRTFTDTTSNGTTPYLYRVVAANTVGYGGAFPAMTAASQPSASASANAPAAPTNLSATAQNGPQNRLAWRDNATNETSFVVERSIDNGATFTQIATAPARNGTGNVTYTDATVAPQTTYVYRVSAVNLAGSAVSGTVTVTSR